MSARPGDVLRIDEPYGVSLWKFPGKHSVHRLKKGDVMLVLARPLKRDLYGWCLVLSCTGVVGWMLSEIVDDGTCL